MKPVTSRLPFVVGLLPVALATLWFAGCRQSDEDVQGTGDKSRVWFESGVAAAGPNVEEMVRQIAAAVVAGDSEPPAAADPSAGPRILFLSLSDGESAARVFPGAGETWEGVLADLWRHLAEEPGGEREARWVRVDLVESIGDPVPVNPLAPAVTEPTLEGIAFGSDTPLALLPGELTGHRIVNGAGVLLPASLRIYLEFSRAPAALIRAVADPTRLRVRPFRTRAWFMDERGFIPLYRDHPVIADVRADELRAAAQGGLDYLEANTSETGEFVYRYMPSTDQKVAGYNILRHAGTTFSLLQGHERFGDAELLAAAHRALAYLRASVVRCPGFGENTRCIEERGDIKLGGNGLAILALSKYMALTGDREPLDLARALARWIIEVQDEAGEFSVHKMSFPHGRVSSFVSGYYPGEALFGLLRLYAIDGDVALLDAADAGARWLINVRDAGKSSSELPADHWLLYALSELHALRPEPLFLEHAFRITDGIMAVQRRAADPPDWSGSFYDPPRSTPTSTRMEGLCAAYWLAVANGRDARAADMLGALRLGNAFVLRNRYVPASAMYFRKPRAVLGAIRGGYGDLSIRIDFVQHAISAMLCTARALDHAASASAAR